MAEATLSLGANVGPVRDTLDRAVKLLCDGESVRLLARSSDYRSPPWGVSDQPPFVNLCLIVATALSPRALLARTQEIEAALGRNRASERHWGPRVIDIDIVAYDNLVIAEPDFALPHPFALERAFVLVPLEEISPDRSIGGVSVREALARLDRTRLERLPPRP